MMGKESWSLMPEVRFIFNFCINQSRKSTPARAKFSLFLRNRSSLQSPAKVRFEDWLISPFQPLV